MRIVSDNCKCSACLKKHGCLDYKMIVAIQGLAIKFLDYGGEGVRLVFQVEECENRVVRKKQGRGGLTVYGEKDKDS